MFFHWCASLGFRISSSSSVFSSQTCSTMATSSPCTSMWTPCWCWSSTSLSWRSLWSMGRLRLTTTSVSRPRCCWSTRSLSGSASGTDQPHQPDQPHQHHCCSGSPVGCAWSGVSFYPKPCACWFVCVIGLALAFLCLDPCVPIIPGSFCLDSTVRREYDVCPLLDRNYSPQTGVRVGEALKPGPRRITSKVLLVVLPLAQLWRVCGLKLMGYLLR